MTLMALLNLVPLIAAAIVVLLMAHFRIIPFGMMASSVFEYTSYGKVDLLSERMRRQQWWGNKFAHLVAPNFVKAMDKTTSVTSPGGLPQFTGAPIEVFEDFLQMGQTDMRIPVEQRLTGMPVHGDQPLKGNEERQSIVWRSVKINRTRKAVSKPTGMSRQITKKYADELVTNASQKLTEWFGEGYHPGNFILATLAGSSRDLLVPTTAGGRAVSIMSHPNLIVAGDGAVSYAGGRPGSAGYEASVEAALNGLADVASDHFSVALCRNVAAEAPRRKIRPIVTKGGFQFYPFFVSDAQWVQLQADTEWKEWMRNMPTELEKHPLATGAEAYIAGLLIIPDLRMWGVRTNADDANVTAGTVEYGPAATTLERAKGIKIGNWINALDTANKKCAILIGASALSVGVGERLVMKDDVEDYENVKGIGIDTIQSVVRNDIYDEDGFVSGLTAGDFYENTSSLVVVTYSKHTLSYV